jgi:HK97 family phage major capsid protein
MKTFIEIPKSLSRGMPFEVMDTGRDYLDFSFSSEYPVERDFGVEILSHREGCADFSRINSGSCPWLFNHNRDQYLGIIKKAWIDGKKGVCRGQWSSASEVEGTWAYSTRQDIERGILPNTSLLYQVVEVNPDRQDNYVITKWRVMEISTVTIPADATVGVGRSQEDGGVIRLPYKSTIEINEPKREAAMTVENFEEEKLDAVEQERLRIRSITALCRKHKLEALGEQLIEDGSTIDDARAAVLDKLERHQPEPQPIAQPIGALGLSNKERKSYSLLRAVDAFLNKDWKKAGLELECSREIAKLTGREPTGFFFPMNDVSVAPEAVSRASRAMGRRDPYQVGYNPAAGFTVETMLDAANFIEVLRNKALLFQMGCKMLNNIQGNLDIPRRTGTSTAYWVSEGQGPTESRGVFDTIQFRPKTLGALSSLTRLMMMQSSLDIEMLVRDDLAQVIALEIDRAIIDGSGVGDEPRGILNTPGIGSEAMGADGASLTNIDPLIDLETDVAVANADFGNLYYLTNPKVVGRLKKLKSTTNEYLWNGYEAPVAAGVPGEINGYPVGRTNQVPSNKAKGNGTNLSSIIFGNFSDVYVCNWGVLDILPNLYGVGYTAGNIEIRALQTMDIQLGRAQSFSVITDIIA